MNFTKRIRDEGQVAVPEEVVRGARGCQGPLLGAVSLLAAAHECPHSHALVFLSLFSLFT